MKYDKGKIMKDKIQSAVFYSPSADCTYGEYETTFESMTALLTLITRPHQVQHFDFTSGNITHCLENASITVFFRNRTRSRRKHSAQPWAMDTMQTRRETQFEATITDQRRGRRNSATEIRQCEGENGGSRILGRLTQKK